MRKGRAAGVPCTRCCKCTHVVVYTDTTKAAAGNEGGVRFSGKGEVLKKNKAGRTCSKSWWHKAGMGGKARARG